MSEDFSYLPEAGSEKGDLIRGLQLVQSREGYVSDDAIRAAVYGAKPGDIVLLAGKGHEDYQLIRGEKVPFDERAILHACAAKLRTAF